MSIFDGMEKFGLNNLSNMEVYSKDETKSKSKYESSKEKNANAAPKTVKTETESDYVYGKEFTCPVCDTVFKYPVVKTAKSRLCKQDKDLRPVHKEIDIIKYDVIHCNVCGYASLSRYHGPMAKPHKEMIKKSISINYKPMKELGNTISYEEAFDRYKLALINAVCRQSKDSEKALICLKTAWLLRGMQENPDSITDTENFGPEKATAMEKEYLKEALNGFVKARETEQPPIAGMNDVTLDYLLGVLCINEEQYENAVKLLHGIISSQTAGSAQKDKARELILEIKQKLKDKQ